MPATGLQRGFRLVRAIRRLARDPVTADAAHRRMRSELAARDARFLTSLDSLVWSFPTSPFRALLEHAGIGPRDVQDHVARHGLEPSLEWLRDEGVYVAYDEWLGRSPIRRGSLVLECRPPDFFNPRVPAEVFGSTSGTRTGSATVSVGAENIREGADLDFVRCDVWGMPYAPLALWLPVLPSGAGLMTLLRSVAMGAPAERWFSQVDPALADVDAAKRLANRFLPLAGRVAGVRLPRPQHVPASSADPVVDWCAAALASEGRAVIAGYASSLVRLCQRAAERAISLRGLAVAMTGEPVSVAKAEAVRAAGATPVDRYAFMQFGAAGTTCPARADEVVHVWDHRIAAVDRPVVRPDGVEVPALLWTSLSTWSRSVFLNVENDDYGELTRDEVPCSCLLGQMGFRTRLANVRGISKVVAAGVTVSGELLERLAEVVLPARFGGGPGDYQFAEEDRSGGTGLTVRVDPGVGLVDEVAVRAEIRSVLRSTDPGLLADEVWDGSGSLRIVREVPQPAPSGKVLPYELLRR